MEALLLHQPPSKGMIRKIFMALVRFLKATKLCMELCQNYHQELIEHQNHQFLPAPLDRLYLPGTLRLCKEEAAMAERWEDQLKRDFSVVLARV